MEDFSIRIIGVEKRIDNILKTQKRLSVPQENIFIDHNHDGLIFNAKRAWLAETDRPYTMVLQDDIELCENFLYYCSKIVKLFPDKIISLFPLQFIHSSTISDAVVDISETPYYTTNMVSGCGVIMNTEYVRWCVDSWVDSIRGDDTNICKWAEDNDIGIVTTIPSLIQHVGDESVFLPGNAVRRTDFFEERPVANWDSGYACSWTNLLR